MFHPPRPWRRLWLAAGVVLTLTVASPGFESPPASPAPRQANPQEQRPWDLSIRLFGGYTDNAQVVQDDPLFFRGPTESPYLGAQINGTWRFLNNEDWLVGIGMAGEQIYYTETQDQQFFPSTDDANDFSLTVFTPSAFVRRRLDLGGRAASAGLAYKFRWDQSVDMSSTGGEYSDLTTDLVVNAMDNLDLSLAYTHGWDDFDVTFPSTPELNERDAQRDALRVGGTFYFAQRRRNVQLAYVFMNNDAEGSNFDYESNGLVLRGESHLIGPLWGALEFDYRHANYEGFVSPAITAPGREYLNVFTYKAQLIWVIRRDWLVDIYYSYEQLDSNQAVFEGDIQHVGVGLTHKF